MYAPRPWVKATNVLSSLRSRVSTTVWARPLLAGCQVDPPLSETKTPSSVPT